MYGLEKGKAPKKFNFDLEREIKKNPVHKQKLLQKASEKMATLKGQLRNPKCTGSKNLAQIADAYDALKKVINKIT